MLYSEIAECCDGRKSDAGREKAGDQQFFFTEVTFTTKSQMNPGGQLDKKLKFHRGEVFAKLENESLVLSVW